MKKTILFALCALLCACQQTPNEVFDQVMVDFGVKEKPEGYVSGTDKVMESLEGVGATEIKRLNMEQRHGDVKFQEDGIHGKYYKSVKKYERHYALDAQPASRGPGSDAAFVGYVEYFYRVYESPRKSTRAEAAALTADIPTDDTGREVYRYRFSYSGTWDGAKGELTRGQ